ncbi:hypothetical protein FRC18_008848 [Serendipita sp. 400]|nr:hypothetical protein FRC18_008848 [Serendipita sp. 400]
MVHRATVVTSQTQGKRSSMINVGMPTPQASAERVAGLVLDFDSGGEEDVDGKATGSGNGSGSGNGEETAPGAFSRPRRLSKTPPTTIASSSSKRRSSSTTLMTATSHGKSTQQQRSRSGTASTLGLGLGSVISDLTSSKRRKSSSAAAAVAAAMATRTSNDVGGDAGDLNGFESYSWTGASLDREIDLGGHYRSFSGLGDGGLRSPVSRDEREGPLDDIRGPRDEERGELEQEVVLEKSLGTRPGQDKSKASPVLAHIEQHQYTYYSHPYSYFSTEGDDEGEEIPLQETGTSRGSTSAHAPFSFSSESGKSVLDSDGMPKKSISSSGHGSSSTRESSGGIRVSRVGIYN